MGERMLSDEGQKLIEAIHDYLAPIVGPAAGGAIGYFAAKRKLNAEANKLEVEADAAQLDAITRHFQALIVGYEARVKDLTAEIDDLRAEVQALRQALDKRPRTE